jgi:DNA-directed RNA polymerase sigma subunit (sigma70/sigma32)
MRQLKISKQITNRESQSLDKYLQEIGKVDLITAEVEVELAKRIREGDQVALEKLTKANLRFVVSVAKQYQNNGLTLGDLINVHRLRIFFSRLFSQQNFLHQKFRQVSSLSYHIPDHQ